MKRLLVLAILCGIALPLFSQDAPKETTKDTTKPSAKSETPAKPLSGYKLEFVLRELQDGKVINTRNYMMIVQDRYRNAELKIGSRVPINGEKDFQYIDVGTNISCNHAEEQGPLLELECSVEISNFALSDQKITSGITSAPVLNQVRANIPAMVEEGKQTVIGIIDDPNSTRRYEIAVTATKLR